MTKAELQAAMANLTAEQLEAILSQGHGRSTAQPGRQLHDLRLLPTATDPRPLFIPSAEGNREQIPHVVQFYPRLLWHRETGREITVADADEREGYGDDWSEVPPAQSPTELADRLKAEFEALPAEDQQLIRDAERQARLGSMQQQMARLSAAGVADVLGVKRGRPKKGA